MLRFSICSYSCAGCTSKYQAQHELFFGATDNGYRTGSFFFATSGSIRLQAARRPDDSRTASRGTTTCRASCYEASLPGEKLVYHGWAELSHRSTAAPIGQSSILIAYALNLSIRVRARQNPGIAAQDLQRRRLPLQSNHLRAVSSVVERLAYTDFPVGFASLRERKENHCFHRENPLIT